MDTVSIESFTTGVANRKTDIGAVVHVDAQGVKLPVRVRRRGSLPGSPLIVVFHGSVNRATVQIPTFEGRFLDQAPRLDATVVSIADPLLEKAPELRAAWYAGAHDQDTRGAIRHLIQALIQACAPSRLIFVGGSTGGHPALLHACDHPDSVSVVVNPILNIAAYNPDYVRSYREVCWPQVPLDKPLEGAVEDLRVLYAQPGRNSIIYLQNARDGHFWHQAVPFLAALRGKQRFQSLLFFSNYFEAFPGHSYPPQEWARWVAAACLAADTTPAAVAAAAATLATAAEPRNPRESGLPHVPAHDLAIARRLAAWQLDPSRS